MTDKLILKLSLQSMKSRKQILFPFIIVSILLFAMEFVMISLIQNEYIQNRHQTLPSMMTIAATISGIFTLIFVVYASRFSLKNQYKELGLYCVLGLEKKHLKKMMTYETLIHFFIIAPFSIILGYLFGILGFMFINKLMKDTGAALMHYPFSLDATILSLILIAFTLLLCYFLSAFSIKKLSVREIFAKAKSNEKAPKTRWLLTIAGFILLGVGYYVSLSTKDPVEGIVNLFIAILIVMIASYVLFTSLSILVLTALKKRKKYYYKSNNFLSTSGMIYRMKSNAISLASISILCTGLIITTGCTASVYASLNNKLDELFTEEYSISKINSLEEMNRVLQELDSVLGIKRVIKQKSCSIPVIFENNEFKPLLSPKDTKDLDTSKISYLRLEPLSSYNSYQNKKISLNEDELLIGTNVKSFHFDLPLNMMDGKYRPIKIQADKELFRLAVDGFYLVGNDRLIQKMNETFLIADWNGNYEKAGFVYDLELSLKQNNKENEVLLGKILEKYDLSYETPETLKNFYYSINGGFLSLGIILSIVMLIGTSLMLYYKQISEGYADKEKFGIMKQIGLEDSLIKKTIKKQVLWIFFTPILVALIHTVFAFNILFQLLKMFGMRDVLQVLGIFGIISLACLLIYGLFYKLTSMVYYKLVR